MDRNRKDKRRISRERKAQIVGYAEAEERER